MNAPRWLYFASFLTILSAMLVVPSAAPVGAGVRDRVDGPAPAGWIATGGLATGREAHTATLLDNGMVLVAGGFVGSDGGPEATASAELYDPRTGTWHRTGSMACGRGGHVAVPLPDGRVLVLGGWNQDQAVPTVEVYDATTGSWTGAAPLPTPREGFAATLVGNKVLVTGGYERTGGTALSTSELYDPGSDQWTAVAGMVVPRYSHQATGLADGRILVAGGVNDDNQGGVPDAEVYDPEADEWTAPDPMSDSRETDEICCHEQVRLSDGDVLAVGGYNSGVLGSTERYHPPTGSWTDAGPMRAARQGGHTASLLGNGLVVVVGGRDDAGLVPGAEAYDPAGSRWAAIASPIEPRAGHTAIVLPFNWILVTGGADSEGTRLASAEILQLCAFPAPDCACPR
jgi:N-acetylneuraminic acid mutarotase